MHLQPIKIVFKPSAIIKKDEGNNNVQHIISKQQEIIKAMEKHQTTITSISKTV